MSKRLTCSHGDHVWHVLLEAWYEWTEEETVETEGEDSEGKPEVIRKAQWRIGTRANFCEAGQEWLRVVDGEPTVTPMVPRAELVTLQQRLESALEACREAEKGASS